MKKLSRLIGVTALVAIALLVFAGCDPLLGLFGGEPTVVTSELEGTYDDLTLESGNLYRVTDDVQFDGLLTIEEDVYIEFDSDTWLYIRDGGSINAIGTADNPIVMRGSTETPGFWQGVFIRSSNVTNTMEHVNIQHTGSSEIDGDIAAIVLEGFYGGAANLSNVSVSEAVGYGLTVQNGATLQSFSSNSFASIDGSPVKIHVSEVHEIDSASTFDATNTNNYIEVEGGTLEETVTWSALAGSVPYYVNENTTIGASLTIEAGVIMEFGSAVRFFISGDGGIVADASAGDPIVFTGAEQVAGYWRGIEINSSDVTNLMDNVEISYAGHPTGFSGGDTGNMLLDGFYQGYLTLRNSTVSNGAAHGIVVENGGTLVDSGITFTNVGDDNVGYQDVVYE